MKTGAAGLLAAAPVAVGPTVLAARGGAEPGESALRSLVKASLRRLRSPGVLLISRTNFKEGFAIIETRASESVV